MRKAKTLAVCLGLVFLFTAAASSAQADSFSADVHAVKLSNFQGFELNLPDESRAGAIDFFAEHFENNNGKHLGFTIAAAHRGNKFGLFKDPKGKNKNNDTETIPNTDTDTDTIPNPEPAAVFLLGTGMAAGGAYARRRFRKSSH